MLPAQETRSSIRALCLALESPVEKGFYRCLSIPTGEYHAENTLGFVPVVAVTLVSFSEFELSVHSLVTPLLVKPDR